MAEDSALRAMDRMLKARTDLVLDYRFWGDLAHNLELVADPTCDTAWTDSVHLGFNPEFILSQPFELVKSIYAHELKHVADGHCWRRGDRDPEVWNESGDYRINGDLEDAGFVVGKGWLLDRQYDGMCVEQIYDQLIKSRPPQSSKSNAGNGQASPQTGQPQAGGGASGGQQGSDKDGAPTGQGGSQPQAGSGKKSKRRGKQGSSPGTDAGNGQPPQRKQPFVGEVRDAPQAASVPELEQKWKHAIAMAAKAAQGRGDFPGSLKRQVEEWLKPSIDWASVMRQFMQQCFASVDYSWRLPSPRYIARGLYLPRLVAEQIPSLVIFWDTSASIWDRLIAVFKAESKRMVEEVRPQRVYIISCDATVQKVDVFQEGEEIEFSKITPVGGGGTRFEPAFEYLKQEAIIPTAGIYFTDLDGSFPAEDPGFPVLWATPPTRKRPPWGQHLEIRA